MAQNYTSAQRMADTILGVKGSSLIGFLTDIRDRGVTWEKAARELWSITDGAVSVSYTTLRTWSNELLEDVAS